jgi:hypothetical protein
MPKPGYSSFLLPFRRAPISSPNPLGFTSPWRWRNSVQPPKVAWGIADGDLPIVAFISDIWLDRSIDVIAELLREVVHVITLMDVNSHVLDNQSNKRLLVSSSTGDKDVAWGKWDELNDDIKGGETVLAAGVDLRDVLRKPVTGLLGFEGALGMVNVPERHGWSGFGLQE